MRKSGFAAAVLAATLALPALAFADEVPAGTPDAAVPEGTPPEATPPEGTPPEAKPPEAKPDPVPAPEPKKDDKPAAKVTYDKGFVITSPDEKFKLHLKNQVQMRFESDKLTKGGDKQFRSRFQIGRARMIFDGNVFGKDLAYKVEFTLSDKGNPFLKDFFFDKQLGSGQVFLRAGQFKRPFNRQEITSDFATELVEKAITQDFSLSSRDLGVAVHNAYDKSPEGLEWVVGVFNGGGVSTERPNPVVTTTCTVDPLMPAAAPKCTSKFTPQTNVPADFGPMAVARIGYNHGKIKGYSEADLEGGPLRFAAALSYRANFNNFPSSGVGDAIQHGVEADFIVKASGFDATGGVYVNKEPGSGVDPQLAFNLQGGYFLTPKAMQVAARFAMTPHPKPADGKQFEARLGFNDYFQGHDWKWVNDVGVLANTGAVKTTELQIRIGAQLGF